VRVHVTGCCIMSRLVGPTSPALSMEFLDEIRGSFRRSWRHDARLCQSQRPNERLDCLQRPFDIRALFSDRRHILERPCGRRSIRQPSKDPGRQVLRREAPAGRCHVLVAHEDRSSTSIPTASTSDRVNLSVQA
jgi:hypothetical protein